MKINNLILNLVYIWVCRLMYFLLYCLVFVFLDFSSVFRLRIFFDNFIIFVVVVLLVIVFVIIVRKCALIISINFIMLKD